MERFDTPDRNDPELEARLRAERPKPRPELVSRLAPEHAPRRRHGGVTVRLALAAVLTALLATAAVTAGGGSPLRPFDQAKDAAKGTGGSGGPNANNSNNSGSNQGGKPGPGDDQYGDKVTICHRGNSPNNKGETLTLPRQAAEAHLREHKYDTRGPCTAPPPPQNVTICHRGNSPNNRGETLTLPSQAAESHLQQHKYDTRGACPKK